MPQSGTVGFLVTRHFLIVFKRGLVSDAGLECGLERNAIVIAVAFCPSDWVSQERMYDFPFLLGEHGNLHLATPAIQCLRHDISPDRMFRSAVSWNPEHRNSGPHCSEHLETSSRITVSNYSTRKTEPFFAWLIKWGDRAPIKLRSMNRKRMAWKKANCNGAWSAPDFPPHHSMTRVCDQLARVVGANRSAAVQVSPTMLICSDRSIFQGEFRDAGIPVFLTRLGPIRHIRSFTSGFTRCLLAHYDQPARAKKYAISVTIWVVKSPTRQRWRVTVRRASICRQWSEQTWIVLKPTTFSLARWTSLPNSHSPAIPASKRTELNLRYWDQMGPATIWSWCSSRLQRKNWGSQAGFTTTIRSDFLCWKKRLTFLRRTKICKTSVLRPLIQSSPGDFPLQSGLRSVQRRSAPGNDWMFKALLPFLTLFLLSIPAPGHARPIPTPSASRHIR